MTAVVESLKSTVEAMTLDELAELTGLIDDRLLAEPDDAFFEELERRRLEHEGGRDPGVPAGELFETLRRKSA